MKMNMEKSTRNVAGVALAMSGLVLADCSKTDSLPAGGTGAGGNEAAKPAAGQTATAADLKPYPLDFCVVSDEKLGSMGKPYVINYEGREIKFCCDGCEEDFRKEPEKFLAKIDAAAKR